MAARALSRRPIPAPLALEAVLVSLGALLMALANVLFLIPNQVVSGGVTGIAILLHYLAGTPVGAVILVLNLPLLYLGWRHLGGWGFGVRTVWAVTVLSAAIDLLGPRIPAPSHDPFLYTLYGGVLNGLGVGLVFRGRGTTGGTDILGRLLARGGTLTTGQAMALFNGTVIAAAGLAFGPEKALYALVVTFVSGRTVDVVLQGLRYSSLALIVTDVPDAVSETILRELHRGATVLQATGAYTHAAHAVVLSAVNRPEVVHLRRLLQEVDPDAFVVFLPAHQVIGQGFLPLARAVELG